MSIPANAPQWLKDAKTKDAVVEITVRLGIEWVIWKGGQFRSGEFRGGEFLGGEFRGGEFLGGQFRSGEFRGGQFRGGEFLGGQFRGGYFRGGQFLGGEFLGGEFRGGEFLGGQFLGGEFLGGIMCACSKWYIVFTVEGLIKIGCKVKTIEEWDKWFKGKEEYQTKRDDPQFKRIYANYRAVREYKLTLDK